MLLSGIHERLWSPPYGVEHMIVIQTSSVASSYRDELILSGGAASQAKEMYSKLPQMIFRKIREQYPKIQLNGTEDYGFLPVIDPPMGIGVFQTKRHWGSVSRAETIQRSVEMLAEYATQNPHLHIRMNFPASGEKRWGKKDTPAKEEIEALLYYLPNNVHIMDWCA